MKFIKAEKLKEKPADQSKLGFGKIFTDYMLTMKYRGGKWEEPVIEPYGPVPFDLATTVFHYAQGIFEGPFGGKNVHSRHRRKGRARRSV